jgi:GGDEF domain-containing protein
MIFTNVTKKQFQHFKELLLADFSKIVLELSPFEVSVSVGQNYENDHIDVERALQEADTNMYEVKREMKAKR